MLLFAVHDLNMGGSGSQVCKILGKINHYLHLLTFSFSYTYIILCIVKLSLFFSSTLHTL